MHIRTDRRRFLSQPLAALALALAVLAGSGCGGSGSTVVPVSGVVRLDGKPLSAGRVTFWPDSGRSASGWIDDDGRFVLGTFSERDGATVGHHRVTVTPASRGPTGPPDFDRDQAPRGWPRSPIKPEYSNPDSSGLEFDVQPGTNRFAIDLAG